MPHKYNLARRHHIGKMKSNVANCEEYEAGIRRRGSLTLRITPGVWLPGHRLASADIISISDVAHGA